MMLPKELHLTMLRFQVIEGLQRLQTEKVWHAEVNRSLLKGNVRLTQKSGTCPKNRPEGVREIQ
jgi:hypothetical protein